MKLTAVEIRKKKPKEKPYNVHDGQGLYLRVNPGGKKTWLFIYTVAGKKRWYNLGTWPDLSLSKARAKLADVKKVVKSGKDPAQIEREKRAKQMAEPTVAEMVDEFLSRHVAEKASRSLSEYKRNLEKDVIPAWGTRKVKDIARRDVLQLLESVLDRGAKNQANQIFKIVRAMFNWAVPRYDLEHSPCSHVKLPAPEIKKDRFFSEDEIRTFWHELDKASMTDAMRQAFRLILVTGQRPGEVIGMHSREIEDNWWVIPPERAKNKKENRVFLSTLAWEILKGVPQEGYLFPSPRGEKPIAVNALAHAVRRNSSWAEGTATKVKFFFSIEEPWTPHDLRRTCASHLGKAGYSDEIIGRVLNHTRQGVTSRYNRHQYDKEVESALCAWGQKLEKIVAGKSPDNVIPFRNR